TFRSRHRRRNGDPRLARGQIDRRHRDGLGRALRPTGKIPPCRRHSHLTRRLVMTPVSLTFSDLSNTKLAPLERAKQLAATLLSERSEASGVLAARQLHEVLRALDASDRHGFQRYLATEFQPDRAALRAAAERYLADGTTE